MANSLSKPSSTEPFRSLGMGEFAVYEGPEGMKTLLGSCVGLAIYSSSRPVGGLAHIVLPDSMGRLETPGKFADTAVPELIRQLGKIGCQRFELKAKIAGGANMFPGKMTTGIGDSTTATLRDLLSSEKIPLIAEHCGGVQGRRMTFWPTDGRVQIEMVGGQKIEI